VQNGHPGKKEKSNRYNNPLLSVGPTRPRRAHLSSILPQAGGFLRIFDQIESGFRAIMLNSGAVLCNKGNDLLFLLHRVDVSARPII
jgi:hypothetical protein